MPSILDSFQGTPREGQTLILQQLELLWTKADVFVVNAPVAFGKSRVAMALAAWAWKHHGTKSTIATPNNMLLEQYASEFPKVHVFRKMSSYNCLRRTDGFGNTVVEIDCSEHRHQLGFFCDGCPYVKARQRAFVFPYKLCNLHTTLSYRMHSELMVLDEAHNLVDFVREANVKRLWAHLYGIPEYVKTYGRLLSWAKNHERVETDSKLKLLVDELEHGKNNFLVSRSDELYHGQLRDCVSLLPLSVREAKPILWPEKKVKKLVLLSATIGPQEIRELGLDKKRVIYIQAPSPIPPPHRPLVYYPAARMSWIDTETTIPLTVAALREIAEHHHSEKGMVHAPYSLASILRTKLRDDSRFLFHSADDKQSVYTEFRNSTLPLILVASGMHEGIDLPYEASRWQVITKVPFPSLAEPAIKFRAESQPETYAWDTIKILAQSYGRVCRAPDDYGVTYILDEHFKSLYEKYGGLMPAWFKEAIVWEGAGE